VALQTIATLGAVATAYSVVLLIFGTDILMLLYKKPEITAASAWLWPFSIWATLDAVASGMAIVLVAIAVTKFTFWARVASTAALLTGALGLAPTIGLEGIVWVATAGSAVSAFIHGFALITSIQRRTHRHVQDVLSGPTVGGT